MFDNHVDEGWLRAVNETFSFVEAQLENIVSRAGAGSNTLSADLDLNSHQQTNCGMSDCSPIGT